MAPQKAFAEACRHVCEAQNWELLPTGIVVGWGDGRTQLVAMEFFEFEREELVRVSTVIGPIENLDRMDLVSSLRANGDLAHGALAIQGDYLCMTDTLMLSAAGTDEIEAAVEYLARTADEYEQTLFGIDRN